MGKGADGGASINNGHPAARVEAAKWRWALTETELERIRVYSYKPGVYTHLDNLLTPYWNWAVTLLPSWAAPNLVTFVGLLMVAFWTVVFLVQSPDLKQPIPGWQVVAYAMGLFFYQTLDAIDGKQARRTNSSSPLGQLFDHGCDALVLLLCMVATAVALQMGTTWKTMLLFCNIELVFYMAQWEEYHTGTLNWSNGWFGVTESQFAQMIVFVITGVCGAELWRTPLYPLIPLQVLDKPGYTLEGAALVTFTFVTGHMFLSSVGRVVPASAAKLPPAELGDKRVGLAPGLLQLVPYVALMVVGYLLATGPGAEVFERHAALQLLGTGIAATHIISRMIVHHMAKNSVLLHDLATPGLLALAAAALNLYAPRLGLAAAPPVPPERALLAALSVTMAAYLWYLVGSVRDMCRHLSIRCFHLGPPHWAVKVQ